MKKLKPSLLPATFFLLSFIFAPTAAFSGERNSLVIEGACTSNEKWILAANSGGPEWAKLQEELNSSDPASWFKPLSASYRGQTIPGSADFLAARGFYRAGLTHLAFKRFQRSLAISDPRAKPLRVASAQCLMQILTENPSFRLGKPGIDALSRYFRDSPDVFKKAMTLALVRFQLKPEAFPSELQGGASERTLVRLISVLNQAGESSDEKVISGLKSAIESAQKDLNGPFFRPIRDLAEMTLARSLNLAGNFAESLVVAKKIAKLHPTSGENVELMAWDYFSLKNPNAANGQSLTLRTAALKNYFSPQTSLMPTIVFLENCQLQEAKDMLDYFRVAYRKEHDYLARPKIDYYRDLLLTLQGKGKLVPAKLVSEWLKSASVSSLLAENNLIIDERDRLKSVSDALSKKGGLVSSAAQFVRGDLQFMEKLIKITENRNIDLLQKRLGAISETLKNQLDAATQNAALMEVEVLLGLSKKQAASTEEGAPENKGAEELPDPKKIPEWNWGKRVTAKLENDEVWLDELGAFRVPVKNQCKGAR